jgi:hypothetical protein
MNIDRSQTQSPMSNIAWIFMLLASALPIIVIREVIHTDISEPWRLGLPVLVMSMGLLITLVWKRMSPLRPFFILFSVLGMVEWLVYTQIGDMPLWKAWQSDSSFNISMMASQTLKMIVTLVVIAALFFLKKKREAFFLVKGDTNAAVEPVKWMGVKEGERWNKFGRNFAVILSLGTLTFLILAGRPSLDSVLKILPFLPVILLAAMMNAFSEEVTYKASFLSVLEDVIGKNHALWLMAVYFGIGHFYGVPYGIIGVLMAGFLGWFLGKSMLETRGLFWAWFIHFVQDVLIFAFIAIGSIVTGGG